MTNLTDTYEDYAQQAFEGNLPEGFNQWDLSDEEGFTVAHAAAIGGNNLPEGFNQWGMRDSEGFTVADVVRWMGHLPEGFDQWESLTPLTGP